MTASSNGTPGGLQDEPNGHLESRRRAQEGLSAVKRAVPNLMWTMLLLAALPSFAASPDAALSGTVRDVHGTPQLGALIELMRSDATTVATALSDDHGRYILPSVLPGRYQLRATAAFFIPALRSNIHLQPGVQAVVNVTMSTMFDAENWLPAQRRHADEPADDWKWALRSTANRPLLRLVADRLDVEGLSFRYRVIDSRSQDPEPLLASPAPEDTVLAVLFGDPAGLPARVRAILSRLAGLDPQSRRDAMTRLLILAGLRNAVALVLEEAKTMPLQFEPITDPVFLDLIRQGRIEGEVRGEARGRVEGEARVLLRLAERRFGPLPADVRDRIMTADSPILGTWLDRLMDAPTLDAVFAGRPVN